MKQNLYKITLVVGALICTSATAGQYVFPAQGQSAEQQQQDEYSCHNWATQRTGFDPTAAAQAPMTSTATASTSSQAAPGSGTRGALRGAGRGWIIGKASGGDSGDAALAGAIMGGIRGRTQSRHEQQMQQSQAQQQRSSSQSIAQQEYLRAKAACLEAKGYTVK